jgi:hypothetical protein
MKEFKFISAYLNSKGELWTKAYPELPPNCPKPEQFIKQEGFDKTTMYQSCKSAWDHWQSSAEVFWPFDNENMLDYLEFHYCENIDSPITLVNNPLFLEDLKKGIDITDLVEIWNGIVFCKSPKDQPEQTEGESQVDLAKEIQAMFERGADWPEVLSKFIIKRK